MSLTKNYCIYIVVLVCKILSLNRYKYIVVVSYWLDNYVENIELSRELRKFNWIYYLTTSKKENTKYFCFNLKEKRLIFVIWDLRGLKVKGSVWSCDQYHCAWFPFVTQCTELLFWQRAEILAPISFFNFSYAKKCLMKMRTIMITLNRRGSAVLVR